MPNTYGWQAQIEAGQRGVEAVSRYLVGHGFQVEDVTADESYQGQDIDLLVRGKRRTVTTEVKHDTYTSGNVFLELRYSTGKPGCVFVSRAQVWCYWLSGLGVLLLINLPALQLWCVEHSHEYKRSTVMSNAGKRGWSVEGIKVPYRTLVEAGVAGEVRLESDGEGEQAIYAA